MNKTKDQKNRIAVAQIRGHHMRNEKSENTHDFDMNRIENSIACDKIVTFVCAFFDHIFSVQ